jgi:Uma2 family endonuclease
MTSAVRKDKTYTYKDYLKWPESERWEILGGSAYDMTPAPTVKHQKIVWKICRIIDRNDEKIGNCTAFSAPTDVVLDEYNIIQPDIFVVCDKNKITEENVRGAPDLIIEVVSPSTEVKDRREKKNLYERFGVREYILVFPEREYAERYYFNEGKYSAPEIFNWDETLKLTVFEFELNLWEVFERAKPDLNES